MISSTQPSVGTLTTFVRNLPDKHRKKVMGKIRQTIAALDNFGTTKKTAEPPSNAVGHVLLSDRGSLTKVGQARSPGNREEDSGHLLVPCLGL